MKKDQQKSCVCIFGAIIIYMVHAVPTTESDSFHTKTVKYKTQKCVFFFYILACKVLHVTSHLVKK